MVNVELLGGLGWRDRAHPRLLGGNLGPDGGLALALQLAQRRIGGPRRRGEAARPVGPAAALDALGWDLQRRLRADEDRLLDDSVLLCTDELLALVEQD